MRISITRYHDFCAGHRVYGHEGKCMFPHGHEYRVRWAVTASELDKIGRVVDFGRIKDLLCEWLERNWDHKFLLWEKDSLAGEWNKIDGVVLVPFNPTAENMAKYLLQTVGPNQLTGTGCLLVKVIVEETRKCSAQATLGCEHDFE